MKLNASCNVIESNIVNCKMQIVSRGEESNEKKVKKKLFDLFEETWCRFMRRHTFWGLHINKNCVTVHECNSL